MSGFANVCEVLIVATRIFLWRNLSCFLVLLEVGN